MPLWPLLPKAIALPSPAQLQRANDDLVLRMAERDAAMEALQRETEERIRTEEMLRQSQKMEAVGQLSGGMAHDFNNMLTVILASLEKARRRAPDDAQLQRALEHATTGAARAAELTDRLLSFARKQPLQPSRHNANDIVTGTVALLGRTLGEKIEISLSLADDLWLARVDRNQLESALINLAVNAQQAMPEGGQLSFATRNILEGEGPLSRDAVLVEVQDTGVGMDAEVKGRAMEPFYTTKPVGEGTGLGLSQVYGFIAQSDGHVEIDSEIGKGTSVRLCLPRAS